MKKLITAITLSVVSFISVAEVAVIVHPSNGNALDKGLISKIYLGKAKSFPDGGQVVPISQTEGAATTSEFNENVLNKSSSQIKAYWSKLIFTGKGTPPQEADDDAKVLELVAANPNLIGYVNASAVNDSVKVVGKY